MYQLVRYQNMMAFLRHAGNNFEKFQVTGLEHLNIPIRNLVEIIEDVVEARHCEPVPIA